MSLLIRTFLGKTRRRQQRRTTGRQMLQEQLGVSRWHVYWCFPVA